MKKSLKQLFDQPWEVSTLRAVGFSYAKRERNHCDSMQTVARRIAVILVPRAYDPSGLRQESRALGATILK